MATYITLLKYTPQGIQAIKQSPARVEAAKKAAKAMAQRSSSSTWSWVTMTPS